MGYEYDGLGRLVTLTSELGAKTQYTYTADDQLETVRTPDGIVTRMTYGAHGVTEVRVSAGPASRVSRIEYDSRGLLVRSFDPLGRVTTKTYLSNGDLASIADPLGNEVSFTYPMPWVGGSPLGSRRLCRRRWHTNTTFAGVLKR